MFLCKMTLDLRILHCRKIFLSFEMNKFTKIVCYNQFQNFLCISHAWAEGCAMIDVSQTTPWT